MGARNSSSRARHAARAAAQELGPQVPARAKAARRAGAADPLLRRPASALQLGVAIAVIVVVYNLWYTYWFGGYYYYNYDSVCLLTYNS